MPDLHGILNINKPSGLTSRDAVNVVQKIVRPAKVGHAGTLDPLASGVLLVVVGAATRLIDYLHLLPKTYEGVFLLGQKSDTEDVTGEVEELIAPPRPTVEMIEAATIKFVGEIMQRPPVFSALKVGGRCAYDLARQGKAVELAPRPIMIHRLDVLAYDYPELKLRIECGSGTYIRSLGRDLAESLGTAAVMSALVRSAIGPFSLDAAVLPERVTVDNIESLLASLDQGVAHLPRKTLSDSDIRRLTLGQFLSNTENDSVGAEFAAFTADGRLQAIAHVRPDGKVGAKVNFPH